MKFKVSTLGPRYDGVYELDLSRPLSTREWAWIKQFSGYLPDTMENGASDPSLHTVMAVIAMYRADKIGKHQIAFIYEALADPPYDGTTVAIEDDEEQEDDDPSPAQETEPAPASEPSATNGSSGPSSASTSVSQERTPTSTGVPG